MEKSITLVGLLVLLFLGACQNSTSISIIEEPAPDQDRLASDQGIEMNLVETEYEGSPEIMHVNISNHTEQSCGYGDFYRIEINQDGVWHMVNYPENTYQKFPYFNDMGYTLKPKTSMTQEFAIGNYRLYLPSGEYRLTKTLLCPAPKGNEITVSVPFTVK